MINIVILVGNVGGEPSIRTLPGGGKVANFSLATSESWKDSSGNRQEKTEWHKIVVFNNLADVVEKYVSKGKKLFVQGSLKTRKYTDSSGVEKYTTEVVIRSFSDTLRIIDGKSDGSDSSFRDSAPEYIEESSKTTNSGTSGENIDDDAIPF